MATQLNMKIRIKNITGTTLAVARTVVSPKASVPIKVNRLADIESILLAHEAGKLELEDKDRIRLAAMVGRDLDVNAPQEESEADVPEADAAKEEAPEADATKEEAPEADAAKEEAPEADAAKEEAPEADAAKEEAPEADAAKEEAPEADVAKEEAPEADAAKEEAPKKPAKKPAPKAKSGK